MFFYKADKLSDKAGVSLLERDGLVEVLVNGVKHLTFHSDGDVIRWIVAKEHQVDGVVYVDNKILIWEDH